MSAEWIAAFFAGLVAFMASVGALIVTIRNGKVAAADARRKGTQLQEIHVLVNSRLSQALVEIAALRRYVADLTGRLEDRGKAEQAEKEASQPTT